MKVKRNLYAMVGMAAWKYGKPYLTRKLKSRKGTGTGHTAARAG